MLPHNLFSLLTDRMMLNSSAITMATYNVLFEVLSLCVFIRSLYVYVFCVSFE